MHPLTLIVDTGGTLASFISAVSVPSGWTNCAVARDTQAESEASSRIRCLDRDNEIPRGSLASNQHVVLATGLHWRRYRVVCG